MPTPSCLPRARPPVGLCRRRTNSLRLCGREIASSVASRWPRRNDGRAFWLQGAGDGGRVRGLGGGYAASTSTTSLTEAGIGIPRPSLLRSLMCISMASRISLRASAWVLSPATEPGRPGKSVRDDVGHCWTTTRYRMASPFVLLPGCSRFRRMVAHGLLSTDRSRASPGFG